MALVERAGLYAAGVLPPACYGRRRAAAVVIASSSRRLGSSRKALDPLVQEISFQRERKTAGDDNAAKTPQDRDIVVQESEVYVSAASRGEVFLQQQRVKEAADFQKKRKKKRPPAKRKSLEPCCYGCGAPLQYTNSNDPGYLIEAVYMLKQKHHQLNSVLCSRCQSLCNGKLIPAVGGYGLYGREKAFVTADELRNQLTHIREERVLVVKLVDIVDFSGSFLTRIRDLVGGNPIILVATKVDLLPEKTNLAAVGDWIIEATSRKKLNVISVHLTSAKAFKGISNIVKDIQRERQGRDVYVLGAANVGKSAFISAMLKEMASRDPAAAVAKRFIPVQSVLPGTTVGPIPIKAFSGGGRLYDTPGVHVHHRIETVVSPSDLPALFPPRRLRGYIISSVLERKGADFLLGPALSNTEESTTLKNLSNISLFWAGLARIEVKKAPWNTRLTFYGSSSLRVHKVPSTVADRFYADELGKNLAPAKEAAGFAGLERSLKFMLDYDDTRPVGDIAISGLGWICVELMRGDGFEEPEERKGCILLEVRVPKGVEVFLRPSIPVGQRGCEWYKFSELSEEQEEARPRLYYPADQVYWQLS